MKIHFIGIGGIGVSSLARYYLSQGAQVSGSDVSASPLIDELRQEGMHISIGHRVGNISKDMDLVIYSAAVKQDNPEIIEAKKHSIKSQTYAQALGELTKKMETIAVSGMHGKSTTTAIIGLMMEKAGLDPTVIVGTKIKEWGNKNFRIGGSQYLVIEADEFNRSFLNYWPKVIVLTNIEEEHLETYKDLNDIKETFKEYIGHLPSDGTVIENEEDKNIKEIISGLKIKSLAYNSKIKNQELNLKIPGAHNVANANAALAVAEVLNIPEKIAIESLNNFSGTWRRMEFKGTINGAKIYDDYGHHPTEIKATLDSARQLMAGNGRLWCVFQPHQYQRTYRLFEKFTGAFDGADKIILLPIYSVAGRETDEIKEKVNSKMLAQAIRDRGQKEVLCLDLFDETAEYLKKNLKENDLCLIMGAGDINQLTEAVLP
jgi:UDP-N-acetylmuramate--alanine ligase